MTKTSLYWRKQGHWISFGCNALPAAGLNPAPVEGHSPLFFPAMTTEIVSELSARFPPEAVITQNEDLLAYSYDGTPILQQLPKSRGSG